MNQSTAVKSLPECINQAVSIAKTTPLDENEIKQIFCQEHQEEVIKNQIPLKYKRIY